MGRPPFRKCHRPREMRACSPVSTHASVLTHDPHSHPRAQHYPQHADRKGHDKPVEGANHLSHPRDVTGAPGWKGWRGLGSRVS